MPDVHAEPEPASRVRDFHPDLWRCASAEIHSGIDAKLTAAAEFGPGIGGRGHHRFGAHADRREVLLIEIPDQPDGAEIGDDEQILPHGDDLAGIGRSCRHHTADRRGRATNWETTLDGSVKPSTSNWLKPSKRSRWPADAASVSWPTWTARHLLQLPAGSPPR